MYSTGVADRVAKTSREALYHCNGVVVMRRHVRISQWLLSLMTGGWADGRETVSVNSRGDGTIWPLRSTVHTTN